jgi:hypothetical protein
MSPTAVLASMVAPLHLYFNLLIKLFHINYNAAIVSGHLPGQLDLGQPLNSSAIYLLQW